MGLYMKMKSLLKTCLLMCLVITSTTFADDADQQNEILLLGKANLPNVQNGDRFIYKLNGVFLALTVGDMIDGCTVQKKGQIDCGNSEILGEIPNNLEEKNGEIAQLKSNVANKNVQLRALSEDIKTQNARMRELESHLEAQEQLIASLRNIAQQQTVRISDYRHQLKRLNRGN